MGSGCVGLRGAFTYVQSALPGRLGDLCPCFSKFSAALA